MNKGFCHHCIHQNTKACKNCTSNRNRIYKELNLFIKENKNG